MALTIRLANKATTQRMPGASVASRAGSGPSPSGNRVMTMKKNSSGLATSAGLVMMLRPWRRNCLANTVPRDNSGRSDDILTQIQILLQHPEPTRLVTGEDCCTARIHVVANARLQPLASGHVERSKGLIQ